jgi:acetyl-CoA synthetase
MGAEAFKAARDFLLAHRDDYRTAHAQFRWPQLENFNYALDWFDGELAAGDHGERIALQIVGVGTVQVTFRELAQRSSRLANALRALGVRRGERILLMLGNVVPLWEVMLAAMKLGAVVIPATKLLTPGDLKDRFERGHVRHLVADASDAAKFDGLDASVTRIAVGEAPAGWHRYEDLRGDVAFQPDGVTRADDPLLLYFTSGTTARPKLVEHSHQSYPAGHLITMYWIGLRAGDIHLNISSPGWAKHAYSCFFAPWNAGATVFIVNQPRFNARGMLDAIAANHVTTLCTAPTVWRMLVQEDMGSCPTRLSELCSAGEPLNPEIIDHVRKVWGKTIREGYGQTETTIQIGCFPGEVVKPGSMGQEAPGYRIRLLDADDRDVVEGEVSLALDPAPVGLMRGYRRDDGSFLPLGPVYRTGDIAARSEEGYSTSAGPTTSSRLRTTRSPRSSWRACSSSIPRSPRRPSCRPLTSCAWPCPRPTSRWRPATSPIATRPCRSCGTPARTLSPFQRVRRLEFTDLPKTISGKIRRVELRLAEEQRAKAAERGVNEFREEDFAELAAPSNAGEA